MAYRPTSSPVRNPAAAAGRTLDWRGDVGVPQLLLLLLSPFVQQAQLLFAAAAARHGRDRRSAGGGGSEVLVVRLLDVDAPSKVERDVVDGRRHGAHERRAGEEERPAVAVAERDARGGRRRGLLGVRDLVVDRRDVENDADRQRQRCAYQITKLDVQTNDARDPVRTYVDLGRGAGRACPPPNLALNNFQENSSGVSGHFYNTSATNRSNGV